MSIFDTFSPFGQIFGSMLKVKNEAERFGMLARTVCKDMYWSKERGWYVDPAKTTRRKMEGKDYY